MATRISAEDLCSLTPTTQLNMRPRVRPETICYLLAGTPKHASNFLRLKYCNDYSQVTRVADELVRMARKFDKEIADEDMYRLAVIAIDESLSDSMCGTCNGKSWVSTGMKRIICFKCRGTGRRSRGSKELADQLGVELKYYIKYYKYLVERYMLGVLSNYEGQFHNAIKERL